MALQNNSEGILKKNECEDIFKDVDIYGKSHVGAQDYKFWLKNKTE